MNLEKLLNDLFEDLDEIKVIGIPKIIPFSGCCLTSYTQYDDQVDPWVPVYPPPPPPPPPPKK